MASACAGVTLMGIAAQAAKDSAQASSLPPQLLKKGSESSSSSRSAPCHRSDLLTNGGSAFKSLQPPELTHRTTAPCVTSVRSKQKSTTESSYFAPISR